MPIDVELSELSFGGVPTVRADWSDLAQTHMQAALDRFMAGRTARTIALADADVTQDINTTEGQVIKLFGAVGASIANHRYNPQLALPTKGDKFDWSLGPEVQSLAQRQNAEYALFLFVRDSYASGERAIAIGLAAVLFGVALQGGIQTGYAALVDLKTGEIAWFNRLLRGTGDLRTEAMARETIDALLVEFPK